MTQTPPDPEVPTTDGRPSIGSALQAGYIVRVWCANPESDCQVAPPDTTGAARAFTAGCVASAALDEVLGGLDSSIEGLSNGSPELRDAAVYDK
jgi:hypothetical protein